MRFRSTQSHSCQRRGTCRAVQLFMSASDFAITSFAFRTIGSIAAAAHLSPLVDYADLDGFLLIENDPMQSITVEHGKIRLSSRPGLGLLPRPA